MIILSGFVAIASCKESSSDEKGVPEVDYGYVSPKGESSIDAKDGWVYIGKQRNPYTISNRGLEYYGQYKNGNTTSKALFLNCADWLINNAAQRDGFLVWESKYTWPTYNNTVPWISCMSQAVGIQLLATAYNVTGEKKYIDASKKGLKSFFVEVDDGGVTYKDKEGWWYEEYAQPELKIEPRVLNGNMIAIIAMSEYYNLTGDEDAKYLFDEGLGDLKARLKDYDMGNWTYYDLDGNKATLGYHELHITLLDNLYDITGDDAFKQYRDKCLDYELAKFYRNMDKDNKTHPPGRTAQE